MTERLIAWIAHFSVVCAANYSTIAVATALVAFVMAAVLLLIRKEALREEDWILYLGLAFGTFFIQYGLRAVAAWVRGGDYSIGGSWFIELFAQSLFSNLNSLCFLLAALALLYRLPKVWWWTRWRALIVVFLISAALGVLLPGPWDRYLDAMLSAVCLSLLSWAMYVSSGTRQQLGWARLNLVGGAGYATLHVVYAFVPLLTRSPRMSRALTAEIARYGRDPKVMPSLETALDIGIFAFAFAFKVMIFIGALLVIMRILSAFSPTVNRAVLEPVKIARGEFLASAGIVSAMGQSIGANSAALYFRLPGTDRNQLLSLKWVDDDTRPQNEEPTKLICPSEDASALGRTLASEEIVWSRDRRIDERFPVDELIDQYEMRSFVNVPLLYHGAAIGALCFDWKKANGFTASDVQRVRQIADFVSPVVQSERWLRAIADLRERLQHYNFKPSQLEKGVFMSRLGHELHDVLAPLGTFLRMDFGFNPQWAMQHVRDLRSSDDPGATESLQEVEDRFVDEVDDLETTSTFERTSLKLAGESIGSIVLAVNRGHDLLQWPSLTHEKRQMESIAVLVRDVVFDLHQKRFSGIVHQLTATLDARGFASEAHWMRSVRAAVAEAGLHEVGLRPGNLRIHRDVPPDVTISRDDLREIRLPEKSMHYRVYAWHPKGSAPKSVIEVPLASSEETLFLAAARPDFGRELDVDLPWRLFIDRLALAADSSLVRIRALELENDAMQFEMNDLLVHELKNHAEGFRMGVEWMEESLLADLHLEPGDRHLRILHDIGASSRRFLELADALIPAAIDSRSAVPLGEVRQRVDRFYGERLAARAIDLRWAIDDGLVIEVPIHLAYLVVVSLIQNSRDAIGNDPGVIQLQSQDLGESVLLHVDDTGGGVHEEIRDRIFDLGFTTKRRGSGRGLPLVRRALNRYKGDLKFTQPLPGMSTRFTICFPRSTE